MKTIFDKLTEEMPGSFLEIGTVWNYHNVKSWSDLIRNKNSNLHDLFKDKSFMSDGVLKGGVTIFVGAKGRSQHSETEVLIFRGKQEGGTFFTFDDLKFLGVR